MPVKDIFGVFDFTMCFDGKPKSLPEQYYLKIPGSCQSGNDFLFRNQIIYRNPKQYNDEPRPGIFRFVND
jgi:hypothetical protein